MPSGELYFSGRYWEIDKSTTRTEPGDNYFYYNTNSAFVDGSGYLHMGLLNVNGKRYASEINTMDELGYGTYTFLIQGDISNLDKNAVLGLFTWDDSPTSNPGNSYNREIDIEVAKWGDASSQYTAECGVQPEPPDAIRSFNIGSTGDILASFDWKPGEVDFLIKQASSGTIIEQWSYVGSLTPTTGAEKVHINLWAYYAPTSSNVTVVIKSFSFQQD